MIIQFLSLQIYFLGLKDFYLYELILLYVKDQHLNLIIHNLQDLQKIMKILFLHMFHY